MKVQLHKQIINSYTFLRNHIEESHPGLSNEAFAILRQLRSVWPRFYPWSDVDEFALDWSDVLTTIRGDVAAEMWKHQRHINISCALGTDKTYRRHTRAVLNFVANLPWDTRYGLHMAAAIGNAVQYLANPATLQRGVEAYQWESHVLLSAALQVWYATYPWRIDRDETDAEGWEPWCMDSIYAEVHPSGLGEYTWEELLFDEPVSAVIVHTAQKEGDNSVQG